MSISIRVMLVEDNPQYREIIEIALSEEPNIELVAQFGAVEVALHSLREESFSQNVDIMLLDVRLPGMSGVDAIAQIKEVAPKLKIIMLTQSDMEADVIRAIQSGAEGYLLKSVSIKEITQGIQTVVEGGAPLEPSIAKFVMQAMRGEQPKAKLDIQLTPREKDILELLSNGLAKKQIADELNISAHTVGEYVKNIYTKLKVQNAPAAVAKAYKSGLFPKE